MANTKEKFDRAVKIIQELPKDGPYQPTTDEKLKFYGLFKQVTVGKNNTKRPGLLDFVGKAKWDAWNGLGEMTADEAMEQYVEEFEKMEQKMREMGLVPA
ncbi:Acyl-CoA-binding domain-containing protein 5 [Orchesella cincta]|uniref:Acyl-CoA-binding domain-containing protein 5 n=1 Tax=Orchesella cincta TaxID=48709 RepID=A0A1D2MGY2_ORCCI|nr:Acyl-CoA-binding domain-containing protein 5 [Orchesella cincta]